MLAVLGEYESNFRGMKCGRIRPRHEVDFAAGPMELRPNSPERSCRVHGKTEHFSSMALEIRDLVDCMLQRMEHIGIGRDRMREMDRTTEQNGKRKRRRRRDN